MSTTVPPKPASSVVPFPAPMLGGPPPGAVMPMMWGGAAGCCPPGGMDGLIKCYCDIQAATAFITAIMIDAINNNPAVTEAIIAAIEKSGSSLPLIGVTNGAAAQPGQVGEFIDMRGTMAFAATGTTNGTITMGVLQPGDWDTWAVGWNAADVSSQTFWMNPWPTGFDIQLSAAEGVNAGSEYDVLVSSETRALISVPTLINFSASVVASGTAGSFNMGFFARRAR